MSDQALFAIAPLVSIVVLVAGATLRMPHESARPFAVRAAAQRWTGARLVPSQC
jgi:hypothetical protein